MFKEQQQQQQLGAGVMGSSLGAAIAGSVESLCLPRRRLMNSKSPRPLGGEQHSPEQIRNQIVMSISSVCFFFSLLFRELGGARALVGLACLECLSTVGHGDGDICTIV